MKTIRKTNSLSLITLLAMGATMTLPALADDLKAYADQAILDFKGADPSMQKLFDKSAGYAVFPQVGKGGLFVGAEHGNGVVYAKGQPVGEAELTEVNVGAQAGGEVFDEVIFFKNKRALKDFEASNWEMSAQVNAVAAAEDAAQTAKYTEGVAVFTLPKSGLMVQATVGGQKFDYTPNE